MNSWWLQLLPELRQFTPEQRDTALQAARAEELDPFELVGVLVALVAVAAFTKALLPGGDPGAQAAVMLLNFLMALPLMALAIAPLHLRRLRRGLRERLRREKR